MNKQLHSILNRNSPVRLLEHPRQFFNAIGVFFINPRSNLNLSSIAPTTNGPNKTAFANREIRARKKYFDKIFRLFQRILLANLSRAGDRNFTASLARKRLNGSYRGCRASSCRRKYAYPITLFARPAKLFLSASSRGYSSKFFMHASSAHVFCVRVF